jgi:polar amino acid transport system substrate-binding protein
VVAITAASSSNDPIELSAEICRDRGRVVMVGAVGMDIPRTPFYMKELELRLSRSYGPGRYDPEYEEKGHDYPVGYVRWTERRNMAEFLRLVASGQVTPGRLTTHRFPVEEAPEAYRIVTGEREEPFLGIVLTYPTGAAAPTRTIELRPRIADVGKIGLGFIGAGSFARSVLLPRFARNAGAELVGIATATGLSAKAAGEKFGFGYCTTESERLLGDEAIQAVVITTRHGSHAHFVSEALRAGKDVFVEKPLALDEEELQAVLEAQRESGRLVTVGFNRRFSPLAKELQTAFAGTERLAIQYRINAGPIPSDHWIHDARDGGGRIIGEVCHFIDFAQFLTGDEPIEVFAYSLGGSEGDLHDTVSIVLRFRGGSVASINYFATGDKAVPKEQVEVFGSGAVGLLDDFRRLTVTRQGKRKELKPRTQEKGFDQEIESFLGAMRARAEPAIRLQSLVANSRATFAVVEALRTGLPVRVQAEY